MQNAGVTSKGAASTAGDVVLVDNGLKASSGRTAQHSDSKQQGGGWCTLLLLIPSSPSSRTQATDDAAH